MLSSHCYKLFAIFLLVSLTGLQVAQAQPIVSELSVDVISVRGDDAAESRLDLFVRIPFTRLRFITASQGFQAQFDLRAELFELDGKNRKRGLAITEAWSAAARADHFAATQTPELATITSRSFELQPGNYLLEFHVEDRASNEQQTLERVVEVKAFDQPVAVSDLILVDSYDEATQSISPVVQDYVDTQLESFNLFYEVYAQTATPIRVSREVIRTQKSKGLPVLRWFMQRWRGNDTLGEISYSSEETTMLQPGRNPFLVTIPHNSFEVGEYLLRVKVFDGEDNLLDEADREVTLEWMGRTDKQGRDIDDAIAQLKYYAKKHEIAYIQEGETKQERMARFEAFWAKRDPTPATKDVNEKMQEYYYRIDFANRRYSGRNPGWQTDRGHTLILYGEPDQIDSSAANTEGKQPYEIWHYHRIGRRFVFIDRTGRGNFELRVPVWDE